MHWHRPTPEQKARGIIAVYRTRYETTTGLTFWNEVPYLEYMIRNRIKRGDDLPYWISPVKRIDDKTMYEFSRLVR